MHGEGVGLVWSNSRQRLEELHLASNSIANDAAGRLVISSGLPALKILNLRYNRIGIEEQQGLNNSPLRKRLEQLDLTGNVRPSSYQ